MKHAIKQLFHIDAPQSVVFEAVASIDGLAGWWTKDTTGSTDLDGIISFRFGPHGGPDMKVVAIEPNKSVTWQCVASDHGWMGHTFSFHLDQNEDKTRVRFAHDGWDTNDDFYALCSFSWGQYMESLRQLCQTGIGKAFGSETFRG